MPLVTPLLSAPRVPFTRLVGTATVPRAVWVANNTNGINTINVYTPDGTFIKQLSGNSLSRPGGIIQVNGTIWVSNVAGTGLSIFRPDGVALGTITGNSISAPQNATIVGDSVWVANSASATTSIFSLNGTARTTFTAQTGLRDSAYIGGIVWCIPFSGGIPQLYGTDMQFITSLSSISSQARFLSHQLIAGLLWIPGGSGQNAIRQVDPIQRVVVNTITNGAFTAPYGVAQIGPYVWAANGDSNTVLIYTPSGTFVRTLSGNGLNGPQGICPIYY